MRIAVALPMPETMKNDSGTKVDLVPIASEPENAWYNGANISPNHAEFHEEKGRRLPKSGLGLTRIQVCVNQCGVPPAKLLELAGCGKGSKQAKRLRS